MTRIRYHELYLDFSDKQSIVIGADGTDLIPWTVLSCQRQTVNSSRLTLSSNTIVIMWAGRGCAV